MMYQWGAMSLFLLTRPLRDVTVLQSLKRQPLPISTHTPLAGRDPLRGHIH